MSAGILALCGIGAVTTMTISVRMMAMPAHTIWAHTMLAHTMWQFITGKYAVAVGIHAPEHGDKPGAEFIR